MRASRGFFRVYRARLIIRFIRLTGILGLVGFSRLVRNLELQQELQVGLGFKAFYLWGSRCHHSNTCSRVGVAGLAPWSPGPLGRLEFVFNEDGKLQDTNPKSVLRHAL